MLYLHFDKKINTQIFIESTSIDLFDQNMDMACAKVRVRCPCLLLKLIYLIKIWVWYVPKLDLDVNG